jgi:HD-GYP domain-containing protein (c-di-GMP phosphodiesterase class II)
MLGLPPEITGSVKLSALRKIEAVRSGELAAHESKVAVICERLCAAMGMDDHFVGPLILASQLHDLGKLGISDALLNKPAELTDGEMAIMRTHPEMGYAVLSGSGDSLLDFAATIAQTHHECFDGSGYPAGLRGETIPLGGRIVALCDVYDALRSDRSYRAGMAHRRVIGLITAKAGRASSQKFDPGLLRVFLKNANAICEAYEAPPPQSS